MRDSYHLRRNFIVSSLNEMGLDCFMPRGAFYVFPSIQSTGLTSQEFALRLSASATWPPCPAPRSGVRRGLPALRLRLGIDRLKEAMERMSAFIKRL